MMKTEQAWNIISGDGPLVAVALHDGHRVRPEVERLLAISDGVRKREEDPFTADWTGFAGTQVVGTRSRFEVDLNRARDEAVYSKPEQAWGLRVWGSAPSPGMIRRSLAVYDEFYAAMFKMFKDIEKRHGRFVVYDLHSYNHRRSGPNAELADPEENPEVNIGTGTMDRKYWAPIVDRFIADLRSFDFLGRQLDVRENVKFMGRGFPRFVHENFPRSGCALAIEFKKFFMDEWTGLLYPEQHAAIRDALGSTTPGVMEELENIHNNKQHG